MYFGYQRPQASFRIQSSVLEETGSDFFVAILREGYKCPTNDYFTPGPASPPPSDLSTSPRESRDERSLASTRVSDLVSSSKRHRRAATAITSLGLRGIQPTPPLSESTTHVEDEVPVLYELYFPAPADASRTEVLRHHLTTRNVLALLMNKAIVGLNFGQTLKDLHKRLRLYMPLETDCAGLIINYLVSNRLNDVRNDPAMAAGLLIWSEESAVRWQEGWREAFVHCVGMYARLRPMAEFREISLVTQTLMERSHLELQVRIQAAEERLSGFNFHDIWPAQSAQPPAARTSFDRFQRFLKEFYEHRYKIWPPPRGQNEIGSDWLTRALANRLQRDFGALYDYLVDRDVVWDECEERGERKRKIVSRMKRATFRADSDDLRMTDLFLTFDDKHKQPHIPHPYPLLPTSIPIQYSSKKSLWDFRAIKGVEKRTSLSYAEATNVFLLGPNFGRNELVEAFRKFEKSDQLGKINPLDARKGRWILLYCILQVLANVAVDTPELWCRDDVPYFLNPRLNGTPPWRTDSDPALQQASQLWSHCWTVPKSWNNVHAIGWSGFQNHRQIVITTEGIGDGIGRGWSSSSDGRTAAIENGWQPVQGDDGNIEGNGSSDDSDRTPLAKAKGGSDEKAGPRPIQAYRAQTTRDVGRSDYKPPEDW